MVPSAGIGIRCRALAPAARDRGAGDPGTIVHALLNIDWAIFLVLTRRRALIGARIALGVRERTLRVAVGAFLLAVAVAYGAAEVVSLAEGRG
jgi:hypothetical protein